MPFIQNGAGAICMDVNTGAILAMVSLDGYDLNAFLDVSEEAQAFIDANKARLADLEKRLGLKVDNLEVGHVDFLKDAAFIKVYYTLEKGQTDTIDMLTKAKDFVEQ